MATTENTMRFDFWEDNKVDQHFQRDEKSIKRRFLGWLCYQEAKWIEYYGLEQLVSVFISAKDGLNSVGEADQFNDIVKVLKPVYDEYMKPE